jgi:hypothetical protein
MSATLEVKGYLYIKESKITPYYSMRSSVKNNKVEPGEVQIEINLKLPKALFSKPVLIANIEIRPGDVPAQIKEDVIAHISEMIDETLGLRVTLTKA